MPPKRLKVINKPQNCLESGNSKMVPVYDADGKYVGDEYDHMSDCSSYCSSLYNKSAEPDAISENSEDMGPLKRCDAYHKYNSNSPIPRCDAMIFDSSSDTSDEDIITQHIANVEFDELKNVSDDLEYPSD